MAIAETITISQPIEIDPHGDVQLQVGQEGELEQQVTFVVCSRTLARVSPVFERMLFGNFIESKPKTYSGSKDWLVRLPADRAFPLAVFLDICHGHLHRIPRVLSIDQLYDLTVLTNYYDATSILRPWVGTWMAAIEDDIAKTQLSMSKALWISWEFGYEQLFTRIAHKLLVEADGPIGFDDPEFEDLQLPPEIIESIDDIRLGVVEELLEIFHAMVESLMAVDEKPRWCRYARWMGPHRCESMILGSMTFCLTRAGLWPLPHALDVQDSILGLRRKLTNLVIHDIGEVSQEPLMDHHACNPERFLLREVEKVIKNMKSPVTEAHYKFLQEHAQKLK